MKDDLPRQSRSQPEESQPDPAHLSRRDFMWQALLTGFAATAMVDASANEDTAQASMAEAPIPGFDGRRHVDGPPVNGPVGARLWERADRVLPSKGIFLSRSARFAGYNVQPGFITEAEGCRVRDADGRWYIDFNCGNGPNLLGYRHPAVEKVAREQMALGDLMPFFPPAMVEFCERLLTWTDGFHWVVPVKRGSDSCNLALRVARSATRRPDIVVFKHAYHGTKEELSIHFEGVPTDGQAHMYRLPWNDVAALDDFPEADGEHVAAVMLNPLDQNAGLPVSGPSPQFIAAIDRFRRRTGARVIIDDVRAGFRIHPKGSFNAMGIQPDLLCLGKALGNGHAIAAVMGTDALRGGAEQLLYTSTYYFSAVCCRAGIATLDVYERDGAFDKIMSAGKRLIAGIETASEKHGQRISFSGPPSHPTLLFDDDPDGALNERFCHEAAMRGALFHPRLNWFLSAAHDKAAVDEAVAIADRALSVMSG